MFTLPQQSSIVLDFGNIPNWVVLVLALLGIAYNIRLSLPSLRMNILDTGIQHVHKDMALVLVHLSFVNPSSLDKIVASVQPRSMLTDIALQLAPRVYHQGLEEVGYKLPSDDYQVSLPTSESLQIPFHISPHQCLDKWVAVLLKQPDLGNGTVNLYFEAYRRTDGKRRIASTPLTKIEQMPVVI